MGFGQHSHKLGKRLKPNIPIQHPALQLYFSTKGGAHNSLLQKACEQKSLLSLLCSQGSGTSLLASSGGWQKPQSTGVKVSLPASCCHVGKTLLCPLADDTNVCFWLRSVLKSTGSKTFDSIQYLCLAQQTVALTVF